MIDCSIEGRKHTKAGSGHITRESDPDMFNSVFSKEVWSRRLRIDNSDKVDNMYLKRLATLIKETIFTSTGLATLIKETI